MKKYSLYIGRWQNWHKGHEWLIRQQMDKGKNVWIAIRDVEKDENNPKNAKEILFMLQMNHFFNKIGTNCIYQLFRILKV